MLIMLRWLNYQLSMHIQVLLSMNEEEVRTVMGISRFGDRRKVAHFRDDGSAPHNLEL